MSGDFRKVNESISKFVDEYQRLMQYKIDKIQDVTSPSRLMFLQTKPRVDERPLVAHLTKRFLAGTRNQILASVPFATMYGYITAMEYTPTGEHIVVGYSTGMIQIRNGFTGLEERTMRAVEFPSKPIYSLQFSATQQDICYAACCDGFIYRLHLPHLYVPHETKNESKNIIHAHNEYWTHSKNVHFYGNSVSSEMTRFINNRSDALCLAITGLNSNMVVGSSDSSLKIYDMETLKLLKRHMSTKAPAKSGAGRGLRRVHRGCISSIRAQPGSDDIFATGGWDSTLRVWDKRIKGGCLATYEGVNVLCDSIDLNNRDLLIAGSWRQRDALAIFDIRAKKCLNRGHIQNRRRDVDGEYLYACRFWKSQDYNRKGKYALIGGSGTKSLDVINLHNRHIACSYPAIGSILAVASHAERIAYGGTKPFINIATFHDPKHEDNLEITTTEDMLKSFEEVTEGELEDEIISFEEEAKVSELDESELILAEANVQSLLHGDLLHEGSNPVVEEVIENTVAEAEGAKVESDNVAPACEKGSDGECL